MKDAGKVIICTLDDVAEPGNMPDEKLTPLDPNGALFEERSVGYNRQYAAMGVNERVDMLIRIWREPTVRIGMYAVLTDYEGQVNENGDQYRIDNVQHLLDDDGLKVTDLTLYRMDELYEVAEPDPPDGEG